MKDFYIIATIYDKTQLYTRKELFSAVRDVYDDIDGIVFLDTPKGKTYAEKKSDIRYKAIAYQSIDVGGLSYNELSIIQNYFETYGRRFGLIQEFKENAIC